MTAQLRLFSWFAAYGVALVVMAALDGIWLGWLMLDFYQRELGELMTASVRMVPAALYYLCYPAALVALALAPPAASWRTAAWRSALLGVTAFGVYDLTNLATLRGYSLTMTLVDMAWGAFATCIGGTVAHLAVIARAGRIGAAS